jgi:hypothetical protein
VARGDNLTNLASFLPASGIRTGKGSASRNWLLAAQVLEHTYAPEAKYGFNAQADLTDPP